MSNRDAGVDESEVRPVLQALGWRGELGCETVPRSKLRDLVLQCPCNVVFDYRGSTDDAVSTVEGVVTGLPTDWARRARSPQAVRAAAQQAAPDVLWKPWASNAESDSEAFLLVHARVWRRLETTWLPGLLDELPGDEPVVMPDRRAETVQVADRVLMTLIATDTLALADGADVEALTEALGQTLRSTDPGFPRLGELVGDWLLRRDEVDELYSSDDELGAQIRKVWKEHLGTADVFPARADPGAIVTIQGANFRNAQWVMLGRESLDIVGNQPHLEVLVPRNMDPGRHRFTIALRTGTVVVSDGLCEVPTATKT